MMPKKRLDKLQLVIKHLIDEFNYEILAFMLLMWILIILFL